MAEPRDFHTDAGYEKEQARSAWWAKTMWQAFPNADDWRHATATEQRRGVDFVVWGSWLGGTWSHNIDAKYRRKVWSDILLEVQSSNMTGRLGWAVKASDTDYLAYAWVPSKETWFIPFRLLQESMKTHGHDWTERFSRVRSDNEAPFGDYTTTNLAVPKQVLWAEVPNIFIIELNEDR